MADSQKKKSEAQRLLGDKKYNRALEIIEKILIDNPDDSESHYYKGLIYFELNDKVLASHAFLKAYQLNPIHKETVVILVKLLRELNLLREAEAVFENYRKLNPDDKETEKLISKNVGNFNYQEKTVAVNGNKLNILFIQDSPCIRNFKYAMALKKRGHNVTLAYFLKKLSERYPGLNDNVYASSVKISDYEELWKLSENFDIIHSHNEPDFYTVGMLGCKTPVIHDTHDLISLREQGNSQIKYFEGIANRTADGRIYSTPYQKSEAGQMYSVDGPSLVFYNYASEDHLPQKYLPKLSDEDRNIHFVYEGGISGTDGKHRDFAGQFIELAKKNIFVHIYPATYDKNLSAFFRDYKNIDYRRPVPPGKLIEEMTQYDFGLIPWNLEKGNERFLASTIANKLFEYLAAGLPVATADIQSYRDYFSEQNVGLTFKSITDLKNKITDLKNLSDVVKQGNFVFTYEKEIEKVEKFYREIINNKKADSRTNGQEKYQSEDRTGIEKLFRWLLVNGWNGYDPYDIEDFFIQKNKNNEQLPDSVISQIHELNEKDPLECRKQLNIEKKVNAKAMGLLLSSYSTMYMVLKVQKYFEKAEEIAEWLLNNTSLGYKNLCWGYPFDWQSKVFIPKGTPSAVVTAVVGDGFWKMYEITLNKKYLEICVSICNFFIEDLKTDHISEDEICFSYTPIDDFHVHNANLFAGEFIARVGKETDNKSWVETGLKTANYAVSEQNKDGSIYYWGKVQNHHNPDFLDSYHSGFEIRMLFSIFNMTGKKEIKTAFENYLQFFVSNYFEENGRVRQFPKNSSNEQVNIHGVAEAILLFSTLASEYPELKEKASKIIKWAEENLQHPNGWFGYLIKDNKKIMIPYLRWGEAWMARAYSEFEKIKSDNVENYYSNNFTIKKDKKEIIFIRKRPQMRFYKIAWAIKKEFPDYHLVLAANDIDYNLYKDVFDEFYVYKNIEDLKGFVKNRNPLFFYLKAGPNIDLYEVMKSKDALYIYDAYDFVGLRYGIESISPEEREAEKYLLENTDAIIYKFPDYLLDYYKDEAGYKITSPTLNYLDYCLPHLFAKNTKKREHWHIAYAGVLSSSKLPVNVYGNNQYFPFAEKICSQGINYHIFINKWQVSQNIEDYKDYIDLMSNSDFFTLHQSENQGNLQEILSGFHFGVSFHDFSVTNHKKMFGRTSIGNKLSTYLEAGLPIITSDNLEYNSAVVKDLGVGFDIPLNDLTSFKQIINDVDYKKMLRNVFKVRENDMSAQKNIHRFFEFIRQIV